MCVQDVLELVRLKRLFKDSRVMDSIADELQKVLSELGLRDIYYLSILQQKSEEIFGEFLASQLWPTKLQNGTLHINVSSRYILLILNSMRAELMDKLSSYGVMDIKMSVGSVRRTRQRTQTQKTPPGQTIPEDLKTTLENSIKDPQLKTAVQKAIIATLSRK